jgi:signal transduction histidine kinase
MLLLAIGVILFVILYQRRIIAHQLELKKINAQKELELIQASIQSEEEERMRIASELHDDVGATLASARLFLYKDRNAVYDEKIIAQSKELLDQSITKIRGISHKLQPATLQHLGLELALQSLAETLNNSGAISASHIAGSPLPRVADNVELAAYRVSQELITNILKHARATTITIETDTSPQEIIITVACDGEGMTQEMYEERIYKKGALGLKNIVNRLKSINAAIHFYKADDGLYRAVQTIPLTES